MSYTTEDIARSLRSAREAKGISQRELSRQAGVPQGHISRIESGAVDLRLSSLIALARVLDLELALVPRRVLPAVQSIVRSSESAPRQGEHSREADRELRRLRDAVVQAAMTDLASDELALLQRQIREFGHFRLSAADLAPIHAAADAFRTYLRNKGGGEPLRQAVAVLAHWRNARAHDMAPAAPEPQRPAYSLDEAELA